MEKMYYQAPEMEVIEMAMENAVLLSISEETVPFGGEGDPNTPLD